MKPRTLLLLLVVAATTAGVARAHRFVPSVRAGYLIPTSCLNFEGAELKPGTEVTVIVPDSTVRYRATVGQRIELCGADGNDVGLAYRYTTDTPDKEPGDGLAIAVLGAVPSGYTAHSCTSYEGEHLLLFTGKALARNSLWYSYYYAGYDTEPTCTDADNAWIHLLVD